MVGDEILTAEEIAARLKLKESWVYSHAEFLGGYKLGKYWRFSWSRAVARIESGKSSVPRPKDSQEVIDSQLPARPLEQAWDRKY